MGRTGQLAAPTAGTLGIAFLGLSALLLAGRTAALTPLATLDATPDITVVLGAVTVADHEVARHGSGLVSSISVGLPAGVAIDGFHDLLDGSVLLSLDTAAVLDGTVVAAADVVRWNQVAYVVELDAAAAGIPAGANVDAVTADGTDLLLSFDVTVDLGGVVYADEDLVRWDGAAFSLAFDGSAAGVDPALDLDGAHLLSNGHLLLSFDGAGTVGGVDFADEDVLEYAPLAGTWELAFDGSALHPGWAAADLVALAAREVDELPPGGLLRFSSPTYSRFESQGFAVITVVREGGTAGAVSVAYATADGTAGAADYVATAGVLHWGPGDGAFKTFLVLLLDDDLVEGDETVLLTLSQPMGGAILGVPANAVLTIIDDETTPPPVGVLEIPALDAPALVLLALLLAAAALAALRSRP